MVAQASTSWSFVGAGLRLTYEVLGPEYSLAINTLDSEAKVFFSRRVQGPAGEDMVEKQNAEQGLMPFVADEAVTYGYTDENRHMVEAFLDGKQPARDISGRALGDRTPHGELPLRRGRVHAAVSRRGPRNVRAAGGEGDVVARLARQVGQAQPPWVRGLGT